jgi:hypothetical protein
MRTIRGGVNPPAACSRPHRGEKTMSSDAEKLALLERLDRTIEAKNRLVAKGKEEAATYLHGAITAFSAGVIGYYEGRTGKENLFDGIPMDFAVGALAYGVGFFGMKSKTAGYLYAAGNGGFSVYTYKWGKEMGAKMAQPSTASAGALPQGGLNDAELARLVQAARHLG